MQAKPRDTQGELYSVRLDFLCKETHPLIRLSSVIDWSGFDQTFGKLYSEGQGRPAKPTRLMVGLHYLKHAFDLSDEEVVAQWVENPYWQLFCGEEYFQHEFPIDPSSMTRWRNRLKSEGLETLLAETIRAGLKTKVLRRTSLSRLNVDTTVQEKAITFPTDSKLYHNLRIKLVNEAKACGIELRQSYTRKSKQSLVMQSRYAHARQMKRSRKEVTIEPVIGHMKHDGRLGRNYLLGQEGDRINAILCGAGHNIRKLLRAFLFFLFRWLFKTRFQLTA